MTSSTPGLGRILPALAVYHLLLIGGAVLLLAGFGLGSPAWAVLGGCLMLAGVVLQFGVIRWSVRQASRPASAPARPDAAIEPRPMLCTTCGWGGTASSIFCPRCHRVLVRPFRAEDAGSGPTTS